MKIKERDFIVLKGPSGAGKTTLLNLIGGLDRLNSGNIIVKANAYWQGADLRIINLMGQEVYRDNFNNNMTINMEQVAKSGLYIVTLSKDNEVKTEKVMIR